MRRIWIMACLAACCAVLASFLTLYPGDGRVLLVQDAFDPMAGLLEPYAGDRIELFDPYRLGHKIPDLDGMAFLFGTQARSYQKMSSSYEYVTLYSAAVVIAVNRNGNSVNAIKGWRTLLESEAVVLFPHNGTEGGRLAAIAMARGLGAKEGDLTPAIEACVYLQSQNRLNQRDVYNFPEYLNMYHPDFLPGYDAVVLWDYQAKALARISDHWDIVIPEESTLSVDCGFVCGGSAKAREDLRPIKEFLLSAQGRQALSEAGFSPLAGEADLSAWDLAGLTYNADFRRSVWSIKRYGPASLLERLLLQSVTLLMLSIAAQRILRRIPWGLYRTTNFYALLFVILWIIIGIVKILSVPPDFTRYCWFATYIPRHILPVCWYCMCFVHRYDRLPSRKSLISLGLIALFLSAFVFTNDLHQQVFIYSLEDPATWASQYSNGFGYHLSLLFSFSLTIAGLTLLIRNKMTRRQQRQMAYAGAFLMLLIAYQFSYAAGVKHIIDFDIPTTVAVFFLLFSLAAQQERFMGASLLSLPVFQNSLYAIGVYDIAGKTIYHNDVMESLRFYEKDVSDIGKMEPDGSAEVFIGEKAFKYYEYNLEAGRALVLEDITEIKRLERSLEQTYKKLNALGMLLERQAKDAHTLTRKLEQERCSMQMEQLFKDKLKEVRQWLSRMPGEAAGDQDQVLLRRIRFLLCICQQRLRFIIRSTEAGFRLPAELIGSYAAGIMKDGQRVGLDGVVTTNCRDCLPSGIVAALLEAIDEICLYAFSKPGTSLICRIEAGEAGIMLNAFLSHEGDIPLDYGQMLSESFTGFVSGLGGQVQQEAGEEGLLTRLYFSYAGVTG